MKLNENTAICGDRVILVPYKSVSFHQNNQQQRDSELIM
jgi:hypothetical protein